MPKTISIPKNTAVLGKRLYVPAKLIDRDILKENYEKKLYNDKACQRCELLPDRHSTECEGCPAYLGELVLWRKETIDDKKFIALPPVSLKKPKQLFNLPDLNILDTRPYVKMDFDLKFTGQLYKGQKVDGVKTVNQKQIVKDWMRRKSGVIQCSPRSGKTVLATNIICKLQVKTLIIAHQHDFLRQFYETMVGGGSKRKPMTNLQDTLDPNKHIRVINKVSDFKNLDTVDVVLVNYQKFIRNKAAKDRIKKFLSTRTLLVVDEIHQGNSAAYIKFIAELRCPYRLGLSATPKRKDGRDILITEYVGDITATANVQSFVPEIYITETPFKYKTSYKLWVFAMKALAKNEKRNRLIVKMLKKDLKDGKHTGAILPVDFLDHAKDLQNMINEVFKDDAARIFSSKCDRVKTLEDFDAGKYKVLIAVRSMIKQGIDLSSPSLLYVIIPMSAAQDVGAPFFYQLSHRIATRAKNKPQPIVRIFVDSMSQSQGCFKSLYWQEINKNSHGEDRRYIVPPKTKVLAEILTKGGYASNENQRKSVKSLFF